MAFSEIELKRIEKTIGELCKKKTPEQFKDELEVKYKIKGHNVIIYEIRPSFYDENEKIESSVAKFKYVRTQNKWHLYWQRASMKWHEYKDKTNLKDLGALVAEVENDPFGCFWG